MTRQEIIHAIACKFEPTKTRTVPDAFTLDTSKELVSPDAITFRVWNHWEQAHVQCVGIVGGLDVNSMRQLSEIMKEAEDIANQANAEGK